MALLGSFNKNVLQDYVDRICKKSRTASEAVKIYLAGVKKAKSSRQKFSVTEYAEVLLEFVYFYLHFTDRCVFGHVVVKYIDEKQRGSLMTELEKRCINSAVDFAFFGLPESPKEKIKQKSFKNFKTRQREYGKYKIYFTEKSEVLKDTLFWEFGKNIRKLVGRDRDPGLAHLCMEITAEGIRDLDPKSFVEKVW